MVVHFFYPSSIVACGLSIDELLAEELSSDRDAVNCGGCRTRLATDRMFCPACKALPVSIGPHICSPDGAIIAAGELLKDRGGTYLLADLAWVARDVPADPVERMKLAKAAGNVHEEVAILAGGEFKVVIKGVIGAFIARSTDLGTAIEMALKMAMAAAPLDRPVDGHVQKG